MRIYLYIIAGITSALLGWNIGHYFMTDLGLLKPFPEIILFPCVAALLAIGMVMNEIFISNPTRPKLCLKIAKTPLLIALGLGILAGLIAGVISQVLFLPSIRVPTPFVRTIGWLLIGSSVGIAEGLSWRWHSMEAGDVARFQQRLIISVTGASMASLVAAILFESIRRGFGRMPPEFIGLEDPLGFSILGLLLGLIFSITNSPSYLGALRAGGGFEYTGINYKEIDPNAPIVNPPHIDRSVLKFVSDSRAYKIEEGLSIKLPGTGKVRIGSTFRQCHIYIPDIPPHVGNLILNRRQALLEVNPKFLNTIEVNGERLTATNKKILKHNDILTFFSINANGQNETNIYRFVYYNRFLDPQG